jgi:hypothetical protein
MEFGKGMTVHMQSSWQPGTSVEIVLCTPSAFGMSRGRVIQTAENRADRAIVIEFDQPVSYTELSSWMAEK